MLTKEAILEIKIMARNEMSIRGIARELGISRNTVKAYLRGDSERKTTDVGPGRPSKLKPFEDWLRARVKKAAPIRLPATVLHRELQAKGYDGTLRTVQRFVKALYPVPEPAPVVRFETEPGHQVQMDWGSYRLNGRKIYAFVGVLGFSRWLYFEYVESMRWEVLVACHQRMFAAFGGVPREILYDNMKTVVTQRDAYGRGRHRFHDGIWDLSKRHAFRPKLCQPMRPQTKGKVERTIDYIANSFFGPLVTLADFEGRTLDLAELNAEAIRWTAEIANRRIHGTTGEQPNARIAAERAAMQPYLPTPAKPQPIDAWPRYAIQRSPKEYDRVLLETGQ